MKSTDKAKAIIKLLKQGYSPAQITQRMDASYNYAWKLHKDLKAAATATAAEAAPKAGEFIVVEGAKSAQEIDAILNERGSRYGPFVSHAEITQSFKRTAYGFAKDNGNTFAPDQIEALDMIFHKLGRILNGDPDYADSWIDIAGYAQLVADRLQGHVR